MLEEGRKDQNRIQSEEVEEKEEDDRISALPNCLLIEILSRLPATKEAIRTGALSKRWQHLWPSVHTLIFITPRQCFQNPKSQTAFALSVDKTLTQCRQLKLKKFNVYTLLDIEFESHLSKWIRYAINCNVEELGLYFRGTNSEFVRLDESIFINSRLTDFSVRGCKFNLSGAISWENLRSLRLFRVRFYEDLMVNIVTGSPLLETFVLMSLRWPNMYGADISVPTTSSLTQCHKLKHLKKFEVNTRFHMNVQSQINNWIRYAIKCNVKDLDLKFWNIYNQDEFLLDQTLFTNSCFTELTLERCMLNPIGAISWKSLRSLCISNYKSLDEDLIENILFGSPVLETLVLCGCYGYRRLHITSKSVKHLELKEYEADIIEINAPDIISLKIQGTFLCKLLLVNVSSLVKVYLNYHCTKHEDRHTRPNEVEQEVLKGYIMSLQHVRELELGFFSSKVLSSLEAKGFVSPSNVKLACSCD